MTGTSQRLGEITRRTRETDISLSFNLDGEGRHEIKTGVPFMDHMLTLFTVHGFFNLTIRATGDVEVDGHHTVEDLGICLGQAFKAALADGKGIRRYGFASVPMDETLVRISLDCANRPHLHYGITGLDQKIGAFDSQLAKEFLRAFALHAGLTLHVEMVHGENSHHILEATFKALGRALDEAVRPEPRSPGPLSSKGSL